MARNSYLYSQLALHSYLSKDTLKLPPGVAIVATPTADSIGFQSAVYEVRSNGQLREVVIAYRGTDGDDLRYGNIELAQNRYGLFVFDSVSQSLSGRRDAGVALVLTGHSLGGAIALGVSLYRDSEQAYVFNASPHFTRGALRDNPRVSVSERSELLAPLRGVAFNTTQLHTTIRCTRGWPWTKHSIRRLSICLTQIAAIEDEGARASLRSNGLKSPYEAGARAEFQEAVAGVRDGSW